MSKRYEIDTVLLDEEVFESIISSGVSPEEVEACVETTVPNPTRVEEAVLHLTICCEAGDAGVVWSWTKATLSDAGIWGVTPKLRLRWFRSTLERKAAEVRGLVEDATKASTQFNAVNIGILPSGETLHVRVVSRSFVSSNKAEQARQGIERVKDDLLSKAGARRMSLRLEDGIQSFPQHRAGDIDYDDGDDVNPNWPSKTGNPSGGGRGNNPPKR